MNLTQFIKDHGHIIAACIAGTLAITAAYIRRDRRFERSGGRPFLRLLGRPFLGLLLGGGLLAAEHFIVNVEPGGNLLSTENPGAILCLTGCIFVSAGVIWGVINVFRLLLWRPTVPAEPIAPSEDTAVKLDSQLLQAKKVARKSTKRG
jgi:hypothetical protein